MSGVKFCLALMMFIVIAFQFSVVATFAEGSEDVAAAFANAEETVISAYQAVLKAEEAGANVSDLLVRLNEAGELLAQARMAYNRSAFDEATHLANSSRNIGEEVQSAAVGLKDSALSEGLQRMVFTMIASVVGVAVIGLGSLWVWHLLRKRSGSARLLKAN